MVIEYRNYNKKCDVNDLENITFFIFKYIWQINKNMIQ